MLNKSTKQHLQLKRCVVLCETLVHENVRLCQHWKSVIDAVKSDLGRGKTTLEYFSSNLSVTDKGPILKSRKLSNYIAGLAELVRVVRSIVATIGDIFCVNENIDLQRATLSDWNRNVLVADAIVVEDLWSEIHSKAVDLGIAALTFELESVIEIRARALNLDVDRKEDFCQLTLQPLETAMNKNIPCTQSPVIWNGKKYMACSANLWVNKICQQSP